MRHIVSAFIFSLFMLLSCTPGYAGNDGPPAKVADLAWMSGHWEGQVGADGTILEENWVQPNAGSIASLVRNIKAGVTTIVELIVIEEREGSLTLHLQQWGPGYEPRPEGPLLMKLIEIGSKKAVFEAVGEGMLKTLGYRREGTRFIISVTTSQGSFEIPLTGH